ncbi:MAG: hypothetical protein AB7Q69_14795 [Gemmatimonadales bacterium]
MSRRGVGVIEILFALVILGVGILAWAGMAGVATRELTRARWLTGTALLAAATLDSLRAVAATDCLGLSGAVAAPDGVHRVTWQVSGSGSARAIELLVTPLVAVRVPAESVSTVVTCGR